MATLGEVLRKLGSLFRKERLDRDLDAELASHLELAAEEQRRNGLSPEEARRQAMLQLGGVEQSKEQHRDSRGLQSFDLRWIVGEQPYPIDAERAQHGRRMPVIPFVVGKAEAAIGIDRVEATVLQRISADLVRQPDPASFLAQVEQ